MALNYPRTAIMAALVAIILTAIAPAYAEQRASFRLTTESQKKKEEPRVNDTDFLELGARWDRQYMLLDYPRAYSKIQSDGFYFSGAYGWNSSSKKSMTAITLRLGTCSSSGRLLAGGDPSDRVTIFAPGFFVGQYLGKRLFLTEGLSLPLSSNGPGGQIDLLATVTIGKWLAFRFGVNAGYFRTGLPTDNRRTNMLGLGPTVELILVPWGNYRQE